MSAVPSLPHRRWDDLPPATHYPCELPATPEELDLMVGRELGAFKITALIGRGGMGRVYAAEHAVLGRRVAIKVLEPQFVSNPEAVSRFVDEARAVNSIRHPNIVDITDFGDLAGRPYYVMELLDGETLAARIDRRGPLDAAAAIAIGTQVASALAAAHDHGVIHRDLKPENIFLCSHPDYPDRVKVLDFGVAKLLRRDGIAVRPSDTEDGVLMGTPSYMSPEQSVGHAVDHRSDVYALGVVLFECLTGVVPFDRPSWMEVLLAHINEAPPAPGSLAAGVPAALEALVLRALAKLPGDRFDDMRAMRAALDAVARRPQAGVAAAVATAPTPAVAATAPAGAAASTRAMVAPEVAADLRALQAPARGAGVADVLRRVILGRIAAKRLVLPSVSSAVTAALAELSTPNANLARIAQQLGEDPLIAPQLLWLAGTAFYASSRRPTNVLQAVVQLGVTRLRSVLLELSARRVFESPRPSVRAAFEGVWAHSVYVADLARFLCAELGNPVAPETVHLGGLLHDVGKPLVGVMLLEAEKLIGKTFKVDAATWIEIVGLVHREVAIELVRSWKLNESIVHVVGSSGGYHGDALATNIVCFANAMAKRQGRTVGPVDRDAVDALIAEGAERLGLDWRFVHDLPARIDAVRAAGGAP